MKKYIILFLSLLMIAEFCLGNEGEKTPKFMVQLNGGFLFPADSNYKDTYNSTVFYPGIKVGFCFTRSIYLWLGYDRVVKSGTTTILEEEAKSTQHLIGLGLGYQGEFSEKVGFRLQAGVTYFSYKEEALGETVSDSAVGGEIEGDLVLNFSKTFFGLAFLAYSYASDDVEGTSIKLGGFTTGIGLGLKF